MKIAMFFKRGKARRSRPSTVELPRDWSVRDLADLPPHHPRSAD